MNSTLPSIVYQKKQNIVQCQLNSNRKDNQSEQAILVCENIQILIYDLQHNAKFTLIEQIRKKTLFKKSEKHFKEKKKF